MKDKTPYRFSSQYPSLGRNPIPTAPYHDPQFFLKEKERIFEVSWLNVGREDEIRSPGQFFVRKLEVCSTSILVVKGKDGVIRAFHNMCSHRGSPVTWENRGICKSLFVCPFHAWSYDTKGKLVNITDEEQFYDIQKADNGLAEVHVAVWQGFIFVNLATNPDQTLTEYLGDAANSMEGYPFAQLQFSYLYEADEQVNWKLLQEAQLEGWHVPFLHKNTLARTAATVGEPFRHAAIKCFGPHSMVASNAPASYEPTPVASLSMKYGQGSYDAFASEQVSKDGEMNWHGAFDLYHIFPNFFIGLLQGSFFTYNIWPLAYDRTIWEVRLYYPRALNAGELFSLEYGKCGLRDTLREDAYAHEKIQQVVGSKAKKVFHFQEEETAVRNFSRAVSALIT